MPSQPTLEQLQRWLQAAISDPSGVAAGLASSEAHQAIALTPENLELVVRVGPRLSAVEQLSIYQNAYFARLLGALREFFPCLSAMLGDDLFAQFGVGYLQRHPSRSYTLHALADHFIDFLRETQPAGAPWADFWIDLARLEQAIDQVFDGPGPEREAPLSLDDLQAIDPATWPTMRLRLANGLQLLEFAYPICEFHTAWKQGKQPSLPAPRQSYIALLRRDYVVHRHDLAYSQYGLLACLAGGASIGDAVEQVASAVGRIEELAVELPSWFSNWARDGFFAAIDHATTSSTSILTQSPEAS